MKKILLFLFIPVVAWGANYTVNVYSPTPDLQKQFIADTTNQYQATVATSPYFANTYTLTLSSRNILSVPSKVLLDTATFSGWMDKAVLVSSQSYVNGWANGANYERYQELVMIGNIYNLCFSSSALQVPQFSSSTCMLITTGISQAIYNMNFSTPTVVPGF